ncbi:WD40 repeat-like protein [Aulographum hederae CBS 113979]|uniref:WD40 repeat-like protein n=1 Tax=Aulographum hederae CBS 113979 TaxID=1176131 RepID=A0A6G1HDL0_9PEZI|nr:WD40 repeat-like protein [Aulographum hederae CBS 113979]
MVVLSSLGSPQWRINTSTQSKQYLTLHTLESIHPTDIFALAPTPSSILTGSGSSTIQIHSTVPPTNPSAPSTTSPAKAATTAIDGAGGQSNEQGKEFAKLQELKAAHALGCHHIAVARETFRRAASVGFGGEVKLWAYTADETWIEEMIELDMPLDGKTTKKAGEAWAVALSYNGRFLASTTHDGRINVWELEGSDAGKRIREYETKGSWGMCIDISADGRFTASGHENGSLYIFNNDTGRLLHSLPSLLRPVRSVAFSPHTTLLAAAGDSRTIALYEVSSGEQVANLAGHSAWILSIDFNSTGEYLLSGGFDGRAKVWNVGTRTCVVTHGESEKPLWVVRWLPKIGGRSEMFVVAGGTGGVGVLREASGG